MKKVLIVVSAVVIVTLFLEQAIEAFLELIKKTGNTYNAIGVLGLMVVACIPLFFAVAFAIKVNKE